MNNDMKEKNKGGSDNEGNLSKPQGKPPQIGEGKEKAISRNANNDVSTPERKPQGNKSTSMKKEKVTLSYFDDTMIQHRDNRKYQRKKEMQRAATIEDGRPQQQRKVQKGEKEKTTLKYDDNLYTDQNGTAQTTRKGKSPRRTSNSATPVGAFYVQPESTDSTSVGAFSVPNLPRRNKEGKRLEIRDSLSTEPRNEILHEKQSAARISTTSIPVGAFPVVNTPREGKNLEIRDSLSTDPRNEILHEKQSAARISTTSIPVGAFPVANPREGKNLEIRDTIVDSRDEILREKQSVMTPTRYPAKEGKRLEIRDTLAVNPRDEILHEKQSGTYHRNSIPGAQPIEGIGRSSQDDDVIYHGGEPNQILRTPDRNPITYEESRRRFHQSCDHMNDEEVRTIPNSFDDAEQPMIRNDNNPPASKRYQRVQRKKLWLVLGIVLVLVIIISLVGIFMFKEDEVQLEINKMRKKIISKLPRLADDFKDENSLRYKILQSVAEEKVAKEKFEISWKNEERSLRRYALKVFFESMGNKDYDKLNSTNSFIDPENECNWQGVTCKTKEETMILRFEDAGLIGTLAPEIALLPLTKLVLKENFITGTVPSEIGLLTQIQNLVIEGNGLTLTGTIPSEIGLLNQVSVLKLNKNNLSGSIPSEIGQLKLLTNLNLGENSIIGSIPPEIFRSTKLEQLYFNQNELNGVIPSEIGLLGAKLNFIDFTLNQFTGSIPSEIGLLNKLQFLLFKENQLSGSIPSEIGLFEKIEHILLEGNNLNGDIPSEISFLSETLQDLNINRNKLSGSIPSEIGILRKLTSLQLEDNQFRGDIPSEIDQLGNICFIGLQKNFYLNGTISDTTCRNMKNCKKGNGEITIDEKVECECCKKRG